MLSYLISSLVWKKNEIITRKVKKIKENCVFYRTIYLPL